MNVARVVLIDDGGAVVWEGSLLAFFHANAFDRRAAREVVTRLRPRVDTGHMEPAEIGGGASPLFHLSLVERESGRLRPSREKPTH